MPATISDRDLRLSTAGGIRYALIEGYPKFDVQKDSVKFSEVYAIDSLNVPAFIAESFPVPFVLGSFVIWPPRRRMPGTNFLITMKVNGEPFSGTKPGDPFANDSGSLAETYDELYRVSIDYETAKESEDEDRDEQKPETFLEHSFNAGAEFITMPARNTDVAEGDVDNTGAEPGTPSFYLNNKEVNKDHRLDIKKLVPTIERTLKWPLAINPDFDAIFSRLGKINQNKIPIFNDAPPETVLFTGISGQQKYIWENATVRAQPWSLDFHFSQRQINEGNGKTYGWNHVYHPDKSEWVAVLIGPEDDRRALYDRTDFRDMFKSA